MPTYFITFTTYGTRVHGDERGSIDRHTNERGSPHLMPHPGREYVARSAMSGDTVILAPHERHIVDEAIRGLADRRTWNLHALNVRTNHAHAVVSAEERPEIVMQGMKAWATRALTGTKLRPEGSRIWTRHGSTRWLNTQSALEAAMEYVLNRQ